MSIIKNILKSLFKTKWKTARTLTRNRAKIINGLTILVRWVIIISIGYMVWLGATHNMFLPSATLITSLLVAILFLLGPMKLFPERLSGRFWTLYDDAKSEAKSEAKAKGYGEESPKSPKGYRIWFEKNMVRKNPQERRLNEWKRD